ncbi:MAG: hypothetical protein ACRDWD_01510, partial [Acidimicrobiia bacterium]
MRDHGTPVIDADGHVMEPRDLWSQRMDGGRWGQLVPRFDEETGTLFVGGEIRAGGNVLQRIADAIGTTLDEVESAFNETQVA